MLSDLGTSANDSIVTKWGYRLVLLYLAYAACQWLDKIKVRRIGGRVIMTKWVLTLHL